MERPSAQSVGGIFGLIGVLGFAAIVLALHRLQPEYDARRQLISELAEGPHGWAMLPAFGSLSLSLLGVQYGLLAIGAPGGLRTLFIVAAVGMLAAGVFTTDRAIGVHVAAVMLGFTPLVLAMYLLPARVYQLRSQLVIVASSIFGAGAVLGIASANVGVPLGIAQRIATVCVLVWLCVVSWELL